MSVKKRVGDKKDEKNVKNHRDIIAKRTGKFEGGDVVVG